ncbi:hypothetical protein U9M48_039308 [Paspalum notatum var. saurae]|uniref:Uncharacterized protein n=1 Tax=Paspalum notatum var. saurae TaxID=547442 RepID=A0AAQ3UNB9_PASNO
MRKKGPIYRLDHGIEEQTQEHRWSRSQKTRSRTRSRKTNSKPPTPHLRRLTIARKVCSSSSVLVLEEGPIIIRSEKRHELALE